MLIVGQMLISPLPRRRHFSRGKYEPKQKKNIYTIYSLGSLAGSETIDSIEKKWFKIMWKGVDITADSNFQYPAPFTAQLGSLQVM